MPSITNRQLDTYIGFLKQRIKTFDSKDSLSIPSFIKENLKKEVIELKKKRGGIIKK